MKMIQKLFGGRRGLHLSLIAVLIAAFLTACVSAPTTAAQAVTKEESDAESTQTDTTADSLIAIEDIAPINVVFDREDLNDSWLDVAVTKISLAGDAITSDGAGASVSGSTLTIAVPGTYVLSGALSNGQIHVKCEAAGLVRIVLNNAEIHNSSGAAIYVEKADRVVLVLADGTVNTLSDGAQYSFADEDAAEADEPNAALYSKSDLTINGDGTLVVTGNYKQGITGKDELKIVSGTLVVTAATHGITGRDLLAVQQASITVQAGSSGLRSNNDEDTVKGVIYIGGGTFDLTTTKDGLNSANQILIDGGTLTIKAQDDAIHADTALTVNNGIINIKQSYEGLESLYLFITGGTFDITSSDDGINVAGGDTTDAATAETAFDGQGSEGMRPDGMGAHPFGMSTGTGQLIISGGQIAVDALGDGIDVNGKVTMTGGTLLVNGPVENMNAPLDYDSGFTVTGGTIVAAGSSGMAMAPDENSTIRSLLINFETQYAAGTEVSISSDSGATVATVVPTKAFQSIVVASVDILKGQTYTVSVGGTAITTLTSDSVVTTYGSQGMGGGGPGGRGNKMPPPPMNNN